MNKYYITFGSFTCTITHTSMWEACAKTMVRWLDAGYRDNMPKSFRVSDRGFKERSDDLIVMVDEVIGAKLHEKFESEWIDGLVKELKP